MTESCEFLLFNFDLLSVLFQKLRNKILFTELGLGAPVLLLATLCGDKVLLPEHAVPQCKAVDVMHQLLQG